jgi:MFS transporter, DHA2 family, multidrug resistance protein
MTRPWSAARQRLVAQFPLLQPQRQAYRWIVLATVMIGTFMAVLDATIVNVALSKMMAAFGVSVDRVEWILTAYLLVFGVMLPTSGWLADRWGYKTMFLMGLFLFTLGSFLCSLAWSIDVLIVFRVLQGSGAGLLMPVGMAIITREFPPEKRGVALGFWSVAASASVSLGPTVGGYLIDHYSWHTIFDVNIPVGIVGMIASAIILRDRRRPDVGRFDIVGFFALGTCLTALLLALASGNSAWNTGGWTSRFIVTCLAVALVGLLAFIVAEANVLHPLIQVKLFRNFNFAMSNVVLFIFGIGMFGSNFLLPIYLQNSLGYTPFQAGLVFLPVGLLLGITAPFAGIFSDRYDARMPIFVGMVLLAWTFYRFSSLSLYSEKWDILFPLYVRGVAMGLIFSPLTTVSISEIANRDMAQASGLVNVIRQIGGSFGVAAFGTVFTRRTIFHAAMYGEQVNPYAEAFRETVRRVGLFAAHVTGGTASAAADKAKALVASFVGQQAFVRAVDDVFVLAGITLVVGLVPVALLRAHHGRIAGKGMAVE